MDGQEPDGGGGLLSPKGNGHAQWRIQFCARNFRRTMKALLRVTRDYESLFKDIKTLIDETEPKTGIILTPAVLNEQKYLARYKLQQDV